MDLRVLDNQGALKIPPTTNDLGVLDNQGTLKGSVVLEPFRTHWTKCLSSLSPCITDGYVCDLNLFPGSPRVSRPFEIQTTWQKVTNCETGSPDEARQWNEFVGTGLWAGIWNGN